MLRTDKETLEKVRKAAEQNRKAGDWVATPPHPPVIVIGKKK